MLRHLIKSRLYAATPSEVVQYSQKYGVPLSENEATHLINYIKKEKIDPFSETDRLKTFRFIEKNIGKSQAMKADELLTTLAQKYNLDHYL